VLVDLEGHGREDVFGDVDLSRTVGWFTSLYPVRLDPGEVDVADALAGGASVGRALKAIKEQLRGVADHGLGYGVLRYLNAETGLQLSGFGSPQIGFNYLGRFGRSGGGIDWSAAPESGLLDGGGDPGLALGHCVEVNAATWDGPEGATLTARWSWTPALFAGGDVEDLAERWFAVLRALVRHVEQPGSGGRTPSDVPLVGLAQAEIERLERAYAD
jgi:non-ribosomal peptide synthase protein (TIGR01720 family)